MNASAHAQHDARSRPRRPAWVLVCLWLLVALMPLRAWAAVEMTATPATAWSASAAVSGLPPCHAAADADADADADGSDAPAHGGTCEQCLFCAAVIAAPEPATAAPAPLAGVMHAAVPGAAPPGAVDPLFRPPRG